MKLNEIPFLIDIQVHLVWVAEFVERNVGNLSWASSAVGLIFL